MPGVGLENDAPLLKSKHFGHIPGYPVGSRFKNRAECYKAGVHASLRAGIVGNTQDGAYSVVLSKGYPDDKDKGDIVYYSGSGGRNTEEWDAPQTADQQFTLKNRALQISCEKGNPVRLIRGSEGDSFWSPGDGYRYDGLYKVVEAKLERGRSGFMICRFKFVREPNQPSIPTRSFARILKKKKVARSMKVYTPIKVDTSRVGIRVREKEEARRRQEAELAAQRKRMSLKRNASMLSESEESAKLPQRPSKRITSHSMGERVPVSPTMSPPTSPASIPPPYTSSSPLQPKRINSRPTYPGKLNTQPTKRGREDLSSPISPDISSPYNLSSDHEEAIERHRKRMRPSLSESLQEQMEKLALPGPSTNIKRT